MLDMPCGKGRHSRYLADKGFEVLGADLSQRNILEAKKFETEKLTFAVHDMRRLFYINYFDFAFNLFTSFGYFNSEHENMGTVQTFSSALKKGGKLVLDFFNAGEVMTKIYPSFKKEINGITFLIEKKTEDNKVWKKIEVQDGKQTFFFEEQVQALTLQDFGKYFAENNLRIIQLFGSYQLEDYNEKKSERLILIAQKI
jgi:SAM-dependent methyltransferase